MNDTLIALGSDHGGYSLMQAIERYLKELEYQVKNFSLPEPTSVDYPTIAIAVAHAVASSECGRGILICGTGIGMSIAANKILGIRAALCNGIYSARMSRAHNNANILILGGRIIGEELAREIVKVWLETPFEGGRHAKRLSLIEELENTEKRHG
ncbi:MAG: ribose 5-phosphate isomerase B [bacterium]